jgi:flagellar basal-body rod modification protein FlgD
MSTIANPLTSASNAATQAGTTAAPTDPLASESTFLTLLVSQLQNQDPLDPVDSNQFVSQLTEYSQLEQLIGIHSDTTNLSKDITATATTTPTTPTTPAAADSTRLLPDLAPAGTTTNSNTGAIN